MVNSTILHFDTVDSTSSYNFDALYTTANAFTSVNSNAIITGALTYIAGNAYNCNFKLRDPIPRVRAITLKSAEIPIQFYNVRADNGSNKMTLSVNTTSFTITLTEGNYSTIESLLAEINLQILTQYTAQSVVFVVSATTGKVVLQSTWSLSLQVNIVNCLLSRMLGKADSGNNYYYSSNPGTLLFSNAYNLNPDNYICMVLTNLSIPTSSASGKLVNWKIPLTASYGEINFYSDMCSFSQRLFITDPNLFLSSVNIVIYDRWGFRITNPNGGDYSFSLEIEYEC